MSESADQYAANVATDLATTARDLDADVSALTGGAADQTVSTRVADDAARRVWWARWFCAALSALVQPGHCEAMRSPAPSPWFVYPRAAFCFVSVFWVPWFLWHSNPALLGAWACAMAANLVWGLLL